MGLVQYLFGLLVDKLDPVDVHCKDEVVRVRPKPFVVDVEEHAAVERVVLQGRQVPHLCLDLRLTRAIFLEEEGDAVSCSDIFTCSN